MNSEDVRSAFLNYFKSKGHEIVQSSALVPDNDPTLLFSNAGMNQFKDLFLGAEKRSYSRATSSQKCLRISGKHNDLENVGVTSRHHTFFEMLGNFSFGDYFKRDAILYAWEFSTEVLKLDKQRIWVTVFEDDDEAEKLWQELTDIDPDRILRMGAEDNFWSMGEVGPCGPCSELHYYLGDDVSKQSAEAFKNDSETYMEYWNLVFMQYDRAKDGTLTPLPKPSVDTGMGLERVAKIKQDVTANYDTDVLREIIHTCEKLSGYKYDGSSYKERCLKTDKDYARDVAMRVIADHSRALAFLIADGVRPGSDGRGYVLRRVLRRAVRHGRTLEFKEPFLVSTTKTLIDKMGGHYPELVEHADLIAKLVDAEERKFHETLDSGLQVLQSEVKKLGDKEKFPGATAFLLHDTYGFPLDLTQDALKAYNIEVDLPGFDAAMAAQKQRSREDRKAQDITFSTISIDSDKTEFTGYEETKAESKISQIVSEQEVIKPGEEVLLLCSATPFYAESGGQVGDTGNISSKDFELSVLDTQKVQQNYYVHRCLVESGELSKSHLGSIVNLAVDETRRAAIRQHHSATHIVHAALRKFLGEHVKQAGSRVDDQSLRFDYSHFEGLSSELLNDMQVFINEEVQKNYEVLTRVLGIEEAQKTGAVALFGEKYGDKVRVIDIGPNSIEFCGGTHVSRSGDIGLVLIESESAIAAGVRRITCRAGVSAVNTLLGERSELNNLSQLLKGDSDNLSGRLQKLLDHNKSLEKEIESLKSKLASQASDDFASDARTSPGGVKVIVKCVEGADTKTLRTMVDRIRLKLGSGVVALGSTQNGKATVVAGVTSDLTDKVNAGKIIKEAAEPAGGKGGGRPDFAQAGGVNPDQLDDTLNRVFELVA